MRYDLLLVPFGATYAQMRSAAIAAEESGFNGVWTWDHLRVAHGPGDRVPECWTVLSALAEATRRIQLGPLVLNVANRHPGLLANMAATLQEVSGGRLVLGIGAGGGQGTPYSDEQEMIGIRLESDRVRRQRVAEAIQVMHLLWSGKADSFVGQHYQIQNPRGFLRPSPPPPIIVAGFGPRMAALAGRFADGFNTVQTGANLAGLIETARGERRAVGGDGSSFEVSVFTGFRSSLLAPDSSARASLEQLGVERLILNIELPYPLDQIRQAAKFLGTG
ncbi:MAG: LLM class flavin-dependent oxidoreductase [Dehalococcoidia bacterium]